MTDGWQHNRFLRHGNPCFSRSIRASDRRHVLIYVAYFILADRKIWAAVQLRRGPNVVGPWGLWQSFADFIKFALKEPVIPARRTRACSCWRRS